MKIERNEDLQGVLTPEERADGAVAFDYIMFGGRLMVDMEMLEAIEAEIKDLEAQYEMEWKELEETWRKIQDLKHRKHMIVKRGMHA